MPEEHEMVTKIARTPWKPNGGSSEGQLVCKYVLQNSLHENWSIFFWDNAPLETVLTVHLQNKKTVCWKFEHFSEEIARKVISSVFYFFTNQLKVQPYLKDLIAQYVFCPKGLNSSELQKTILDCLKSLHWSKWDGKNTQRLVKQNSH